MRNSGFTMTGSAISPMSTPPVPASCAVQGHVAHDGGALADMTGRGAGRQGRARQFGVTRFHVHTGAAMYRAGATGALAIAHHAATEPARGPGAVAAWRACRAGMVLLLLSLACLLPGIAAADTDYLAPEAAFAFSARMVDAHTAQVDYAIADGYYMYRDRFHFSARNATLGEPQFPAGKVKYDANFQKEVETYRDHVSIRVPVTAAGAFTITSTAQGCADQGLCYPPMDSSTQLDPALIGPAASSIPANASNDEGRIGDALRSRRLLQVLPLFFLLGIGLAFTPCVFPMYPILSSIIVGDSDGKPGRARGLLLSVVYSLGMALVYMALGVAAGLLGEGLAARLQNPWVLSVCALVMLALALSMFGLYQVQLPASWQTGLTQASGRRAGGKLLGVFAMGVMSALVVGPCVAPPLAGLLLYISRSRDVFVGGAGLFALAIGMSVPLMLIGASAGALLPRAGAWMDDVKRLFGVLMLATAWWMLAPMLPAWLAIAGWAALGIAYGAYLLWQRGASWRWKALGLVFATLGVLQLANVASGGRDALRPLAAFGGPAAATGAPFTRIKTVAQLDAALANTGGRPVLLDFYADWCVSCIEMEKQVFPDPAVKARMQQFVLLQADVTANDADDKALLKRFDLFGPPGTILFDHAGKEIPGGRVIGYRDVADFLKALQGAQ